jgi:hypothetical protein
MFRLSQCAQHQRWITTRRTLCVWVYDMEVSEDLMICEHIFGGSVVGLVVYNDRS